MVPLSSPFNLFYLLMINSLLFKNTLNLYFTVKISISICQESIPHIEEALNYPKDQTWALIN